VVLSAALRSIPPELERVIQRLGGLRKILTDSSVWRIKRYKGVEHLYLDGVFDDGIKYEINQEPGGPTDLTIRHLPGYSDRSLRIILELEAIWVKEGRDDMPWPTAEALDRFWGWTYRGLEGSLDEFWEAYDDYGEGIDPLDFEPAPDTEEGDTEPDEPPPRSPRSPPRDAPAPTVRPGPSAPAASSGPGAQDTLAAWLRFARAPGGRTWAEELRSRPTKDFHDGRVRGRDPTPGPLFLPLVNFLRGLQGRAADEVEAVLGFAPNARLSRNIPRLQRLSFRLIDFLRASAVLGVPRSATKRGPWDRSL
jgi:hypothetical protein